MAMAAPNFLMRAKMNSGGEPNQIATGIAFLVKNEIIAT